MIITDENILKSLTYGSKVKIELKCDYCNDVFNREYRRHIEIEESKLINKDCCKKCLKIKNIEEFLIKINNNQIEDIITDLTINNKDTISGIYSIRNIKNNKSYIGSSKDIVNRWKSHIVEINNGKHHCEDFNKMNIFDLEFIFLEGIEEINKLVHTEYLYINLFKTHHSDFGYNTMSKIRGANKTNHKKSPVKLRTKLKYSDFTIDDIKDIKQLLANGVNIKEVASKFNAHYSTIQSIKTCNTWKDVFPELNEVLLNIKYIDTHKGEKNSCSKLTENDVREIKYLLNNTNRTMTDIASEYKVSRTLIGYIKRGKLWSFVS